MYILINGRLVRRLFDETEHNRSVADMRATKKNIVLFNVIVVVVEYCISILTKNAKCCDVTIFYTSVLA